LNVGGSWARRGHEGSDLRPDVSLMDVRIFGNSDTERRVARTTNTYLFNVAGHVWSSATGTID
jgi:hypothetical protein